MILDFEELREKALKVLANKKNDDTAVWGNDVKRLVDELSIHQIELEYQNEELVRAQAEIQSKNDELIDLFDNAPVGQVVLDKDYTIIKVNFTFSRLLLLQKEEMIGNTLDSYIAPIFKDTFYHFFKLLRGGDMYAQTDLKIRSSRKSDTYVRLDGSSQKNASFFRLAVTDISLQKRLEEQLRKETEKVMKSETEFRQIVEQASDVFFYLRINNKVIDYVSPTVTDILGYSQYETLNMRESDILGIVDPDYRERYMDLVSNILKSEVLGTHHYSNEFLVLNKFGEKVWVRGTFTLIRDDSGVPYQIMGALHDISKDKENQQKLIEAKKSAEENDRLKSAFLANMSHEIRNPLNAVLGFASVLKERMEEIKDNDAIEYVDIIEKNGHRLLELINDIINISKIQANQMVLSNSSFDLTQLMEDTYDVFTLSAQEKNISLVCEYSNKEPLMIYCDKDKLISCIDNLIKNAIKYTNEGSVTYGASVNSKNVLRFYVTDTGVGVPVNKQNSIFNRFSQVSQTKTEEGVGLGLSIVKGLISLFNGKISLKSKVGQGSTFSFTIPLSKEKKKR